MASYREVRGRQLNSKQRALLRLALSFFTWRTLVPEGRLKQVATRAVLPPSALGCKELEGDTQI